MSERINLSVPARGKAHLTFDVGTEKPLDITLIYTQDITGTFLPQFRAFTEIENPFCRSFQKTGTILSYPRKS